MITENEIVYIIKNELDWVSSGTLINIVDVKGIAKAIIDKIKEKENNKTGFTLDRESFKNLKGMSDPEYQKD